MKNRFLIGEVSEYLGVSRDTLRYYDKDNILKPSIIGKNGYRYYTIEDIIKLSYVIAFREINISIKEIKDIINNCTLEQLKKVLQDKESDIYNKILELKKLKKTVSNFKYDIEKTIKLLNKIEIVNSPIIFYEELADGMDLKTYKIMDKFNSYEYLNEVTFSSVIKKEFFKINKVENNIVYAISGIVYKSDYIGNLIDYKCFKYDKCIHSIFKINIDITEESIMYLKKYIDGNNIEIIGDSVARFITFENKNDKTTDYIEIWIPIK